MHLFVYSYMLIIILAKPMLDYLLAITLNAIIFPPSAIQYREHYPKLVQLPAPVKSMHVKFNQKTRKTVQVDPCTMESELHKMIYTLLEFKKKKKKPLYYMS